MEKKQFQSLLTIREINSNKSVGVTFPVNLVKKTGLKPGKYFCHYEKDSEGKWILSIKIDNLLQGVDT